MMWLNRLLKRFANRNSGEKKAEKPAFPCGYSNDEIEIFEKVKSFTMTDKRRILALIHAVKYIQRASVPGAIVECGVWRGGSMMACALQLLNMGSVERELYLFDAFEGMPQPGEQDIGFDGTSANELFNSTKTQEDSGSDWCRSHVGSVRDNFAKLKYPDHLVNIVKGYVEETIPETAPDEIALLRLDTDWYQSTYHELCHLFPRLTEGGVLIVDDYWYWRGSKDAVDKYFRENDIHMLLVPVDGGAVIGVKSITSKK